MRNLKISVFIAVFIVMMSFNICFAGKIFSDIEGTKYELPARIAYELNLIREYPDGDYKVDEEVSRAYIIKTLIKAYRIEADEESAREDNIFSDVNSNHWASGYINLAFDRGFLREEVNTNFRPDEAVTYAEALTYCVRVLGYGSITDKEGTWPTNYVMRAVKLDLLNSISFKANDKLTRGDFAILLYNFLNTPMWKASSKEDLTFLESMFPDKVEEVESLMEVKTLTFEESEITLEQGELKNIKLFITPSYATEEITYTSSDTSIATVRGYDKTVKITAKAPGTCEVIAKTKNVTETCTINVISDEEVLPTNIILSENSVKTCIGMDGIHNKLKCSDLIEPTITPQNTIDKKVMWKSSDESIVSIENDYIVAKRVGKVVLTAMTVNELSATCNLEIVDHEVSTDRNFKYDDDNHWQMSICHYCLNDIEKVNIESHIFVNGKCKCGKETLEIDDGIFEFEEKILNLELGRSKQLKLNMTTNEEVTYTSSDNSMVTVDAYGNMKAIKASGIVKITAKSESGKRATCKVVVPITGKMQMRLGITSELEYLNSDDVCTSTDPTVVAIENGKYVGKKIGQCELVSYLKNNSNIITARVSVEVKESLELFNIDVKGLKSNTIEVGNEIDLEAEIIPMDKSIDVSKYKINWQSSDKNVAVVKGNNRKAILTAKNPGTCSIEVWSDGAKTILRINVVEASSDLVYEDVKKDDWYKDSVKYVTDNKLMNGMGENKFSPTSNMTRGMIVTVLYRMSKSTDNEKSNFIDVGESEYYSVAVGWAAKNEIVNGIGDNKFDPNAEITREQLIVILYRYAKFMKANISNGEDTNILSYDDYNEVSEYSITAFQWGCEEGIISGRTPTTLNPKGTASRAEVATMLMRYMEK